MKLADLQRLIRTNAIGKTLKEVRVLDEATDEVFNIVNLTWDEKTQTVLIHTK
jgi:hypothetical protein